MNIMLAVAKGNMTMDEVRKWGWIYFYVVAHMRSVQFTSV